MSVDLARLVFTLLLAGLGGLLGANAALTAARLTHHKRLADRIIGLAAPVVWLFRIGGDGRGRAR